jgi:hypothetical protein
VPSAKSLVTPSSIWDTHFICCSHFWASTWSNPSRGLSTYDTQRYPRMGPMSRIHQIGLGAFQGHPYRVPVRGYRDTGDAPCFRQFRGRRTKLGMARREARPKRPCEGCLLRWGLGLGTRARRSLVTARTFRGVRNTLCAGGSKAEDSRRLGGIRISPPLPPR